MWRSIEADGCRWEVRSQSAPDNGRNDEPAEGAEILEFRPLDALRQPRRVAISAGALAQMDDRDLHAAFRRSLPIGGDSYGRPGKPVNDPSG
jgi:hypothetical protein